MGFTGKIIHVLTLSLLSSLVAANTLWARSPGEATLGLSDEETTSPSGAFQLRDPTRERSTFFVPALSLFLPGFGQWLEGQRAYGALYSGGAAASYLLGSYFTHQAYLKSGGTNADHPEELDLPDSKDPDIRCGRIGNQLFNTFGFMSAYHSFRTAAQSNHRGSYGFLREAESPADLALAPFRFSFLLRPTTFIPLTLGAALFGAILTTPASTLANDNQIKNFHGDDALFSSIYAYNAGVGEEAVFRGWLMPYLHGNGLSAELANLTSAITFGLLHLSAENKSPWFQSLAGYYLGYVSQKNNWSLSESIFIHAWWDVFAISASYAFSSLDKPQASPIIWLPPLHIFL